MLKRSLILTFAVVLSLLLANVAFARGFKYDFDSGVQGWVGKPFDDQWSYGETKVEHDTTTVADGKGSLKVTFEPGKYLKYQVQGPVDGVEPGKKFTYKVYVPEDANLKAIQPFHQFGDGWTWKDRWIDQFQKGAWNEIEYEISADTVDPVQVMGIQFEFNTFLKDPVTVYIDSVDDGTGAAAPAGESAGEETGTAENPKTGVGSVIPFVLLAGISGTVLLSRKRK